MFSPLNTNKTIDDYWLSHIITSNQTWQRNLWNITHGNFDDVPIQPLLYGRMFNCHLWKSTLNVVTCRTPWMQRCKDHVTSMERMSSLSFPAFQGMFYLFGGAFISDFTEITKRNWVHSEIPDFRYSFDFYTGQCPPVISYFKKPYELRIVISTINHS